MRDRLITPPVVPSSFWTTDELRDAFAARHMGRVARAYRRHPFHTPAYGPRGITQALLGQWIGLSQPQVNRIENGTAPKHMDSLAHWARTLRIPPDVLWFDLPEHRRRKAASVNDLFSADGDQPVVPGLNLSSDDWTHADNDTLAELLRAGADLPMTTDTVSRLVHQWLVVEPPQLAETAAGRNIGESLVTKVERRVAQLRRMDDFVAGGDLHELVKRELHTTTGLLRDAAYGEALGRRLLVAIGELCQLAGWVTGDAGDYPAAARFYSVGVKAAHAAGNAPLAGNLISTLAYQVSNVGNPRDAVLLAQTAASGAKHQATPTTRALFGERVAWTNARAGDIKQTERALAAVETDFARRAVSDDPTWVYWLDENEISIMAGRCYVELGLAARAVPLLSAALSHYDERRGRERALYLSWLAEAQIAVGEIDEAAATATEVLTLTARTTSARSDARVRLLRNKLRPHRAVSVVAEFESLAGELSGR